MTKEAQGNYTGTKNGYTSSCSTITNTAEKRQFKEALEAFLWSTEANAYKNLQHILTKHLHRKKLSTRDIFEIINSTSFKLSIDDNRAIINQLPPQVYYVKEDPKSFSNFYRDFYNNLPKLGLSGQPALIQYNPLTTKVSLISSIKASTNLAEVNNKVFRSYQKALDNTHPKLMGAIRKRDSLVKMLKQPDQQTFEQAISNKDNCQLNNLRLILWQFSAPNNYKQAMQNIGLEGLKNIIFQPDTLEWFLETIAHSNNLNTITDTLKNFLNLTNNLTTLNETIKNNALSAYYHQALTKIITTQPTGIDNNLVMSHLSTMINTEGCYLFSNTYPKQESTPLSSYFDLLYNLTYVDRSQANKVATLCNHRALTDHIRSLDEQPSTFTSLYNLLSQLKDLDSMNTVWQQQGLGIAYLQRCLPSQVDCENSQEPTLAQQQAQDLLYDLTMNNWLNHQQLQTVIKAVPNAKINIWQAHKRHDDIGMTTSDANALIDSKQDSEQHSKVVNLTPTQRKLKNIFDIQRSITQPKLNHGVYKSIAQDTSYRKPASKASILCASIFCKPARAKKEPAKDNDYVKQDNPINSRFIQPVSVNG